MADTTEKPGDFAVSDANQAELMVAGAQASLLDIEVAMFSLAGRLRVAQTDFFADFSRSLLELAPYSKSQLFQDAFAAFVAAGQPRFFIEVGTGDGENISNTYLLEKRLGWSGIVVEPNPIFLPLLKKNRDCTISTACVFDASGKTMIFRCTQDPEFSQVASGVSDMHQERRMADFKEIEVTTTSLNDLLVEHGCPAEMGFLSLDVEGAEFDILHTFDFKRWSFDAICVEHNYGPAREQILTLLTEHGYVRVFENFSQWDDWYVHRRILDRYPSLLPLLKQDEEEPATAADAPNFVRWALKALERGDLAVAEALARQALDLDPQFGAAFRTLADVAVRGGKRALARRHWVAALELDPSDYWAHVGMAELLAASGSIPEALEYLERASGLPGDSSRARELSGKLRSRLGLNPDLEPSKTGS